MKLSKTWRLPTDCPGYTHFRVVLNDMGYSVINVPIDIFEEIRLDFFIYSSIHLFICFTD